MRWEPRVRFAHAVDISLCFLPSQPRTSCQLNNKFSQISGEHEHDDEHDDDEKKDTYIRRSLRLALEQDIYHCQRTLLTIQMCNIKQNNYSKWPTLSGQRMIKNYWIPVPIRELTFDSYPYIQESTLDSHQHVFSLPELNGTCHIQREPVLSRTLTFKLINV